MKKLVYFLVLAIVAGSFYGCGTVNMSQPTGAVNVNAEANLKADVVVGEKISGESSMNTLFWVLNFGGDKKFADGVSYGVSSNPFDPTVAIKAAAAYDAVTKSGADVIIAPRYIVEVDDFMIFKRVTAKVTGYKGTIKSIN